MQSFDIKIESITGARTVVLSSDDNKPDIILMSMYRHGRIADDLLPAGSASLNKESVKDIIDVLQFWLDNQEEDDS